MVVVPLPNPPADLQVAPDAAQDDSNYWLRVAAGGSLLAGALLFFSGKHRAGLLAALAGTSLAMIDQQETVLGWWNALPGLIDEGGRILGQAQGVVDNLDTQRQKLKTLVGR
jgi:hypothetical protein